MEREESLSVNLHNVGDQGKGKRSEFWEA